MKKIVWILMGIMLMTQIRCAQPPAPQDACGFVQNSEGQRVSWKNSGPVKLYFDSSFPSQYYSDVQAGIATWEAAIGHKVFDLQMTPLPTSTPAQDGVSVIYWVSTWDASTSQQQANTTIYWQDNRITEADMRINAQNYTYSENPGPTDVDIQSLVLHELGHVLGLKHDDPDQSVMDAYLNSGFQRRSLYSDDTTHINCEY